MTLLKSSSFSNIKSALSAQVKPNTAASDSESQTSSVDEAETQMTVSFEAPKAQPFTAQADKKDAFQDIITNFEQAIEQLKDVQWGQKDDEVRFEGLLNNQSNMIIRRDLNKTVLFANEAFCKAYDLDAQAILGTEYSFDAEDTREDFSVFSKGEDRVKRNAAVSVEGESRWIDWQDIAVQDETGQVVEVQSIGHDVTEQRNVEENMKKAIAEAEAANEAKSRFLAAMSHEIRTPMNGIIGMSDLLMDTELTAEQQTYTTSVSKSAKSLLSLINEILDFSKIEAGHIDLTYAPFDMIETIESVTELLSPRAHEKGLSIGYYMNPDLPRNMIGDEGRFRQVLMNLAGNAIKFTETGGLFIHVSGEETVDDKFKLNISVEDTGIGIKDEDIEKIFEEFEQADGTTTRRYGGTGLGLAISNTLVTEMGGVLNVDSTFGEGSTFYLDIEMEADKADKKVKDAWSGLSSTDRILVATEARIEAILLVKFLREAKIDVDFSNVANARSQINKAATQGRPYSMVIVDAGMGFASADQLFKAASHMCENPVKAIVLVEPAERGQFPGFKEAGFGAYLVRPVRPVSLFQQIVDVEAITLEEKVELKPKRERSALKDIITEVLDDIEMDAPVTGPAREELKLEEPEVEATPEVAATPEPVKKAESKPLFSFKSESKPAPAPVAEVEVTEEPEVGIMGSRLHAITKAPQKKSSIPDNAFEFVMPTSDEDEDFDTDEDMVSEDVVTKTSLDIEGRNGNKPHILVVDDNNINALLIRKMLENAGCTVSRAENGIEAVDMIAQARKSQDQSQFELVMMDMHMPEMDGVEATKSIRALEIQQNEFKTKNIPIVAMTANALESDRKRFTETGMCDYLSKPFERDDLINILMKWNDKGWNTATKN